MKTLKTTLLIALLSGCLNSFSQNNTLPTNGNVGIGTSTPSVKLEVCGKMKVDSAASFKNKLIVSGLTKMKGNATLMGS